QSAVRRAELSQALRRAGLPARDPRVRQARQGGAPMKCPACGQDNKDAAKFCRKCDRDLALAPAWFPDAAWHLRTLGIIYAALIFLYFGVSAALARMPKPYNL